MSSCLHLEYKSMIELIDIDSDTVECMMCRTSDLATISKPCFREGELSTILPDNFHGSAHLHVSAVLYVQVDASSMLVKLLAMCSIVLWQRPALLLTDQCIIGFESLLDLIGCEGR